MTRLKRKISNNGTPTKLDPRGPGFALEFRRAAKTFSAKNTQSRKTATKVLVEMGILTPTGKLSKNYR